MPCPVCSNDSTSDAAAHWREAERMRDAAGQFASEAIRVAQAIRDISSRLRHKTGADPEAADMLDTLARRMVTETTQAISRLNEPCALPKASSNTP